jgi:hypothetical protein
MTAYRVRYSVIASRASSSVLPRRAHPGQSSAEANTYRLPASVKTSTASVLADMTA